MNRLLIDGCTASFTLEESEQVTSALCNDLAFEGQSAGVLHIDILIPLDRVGSERSVLESGNFQWAGVQQRNENGRSVDYAIFRQCVRSGISLSQNTTLAPSPIEVAAVELMRSRIAQLRDTSKFEAMNKKEPDVPEVESPIFTKLRAEIEVMEQSCKS